MGQHDISPQLDPDAIREFTKALLIDLRALERILSDGLVEGGCCRCGVEQELFLVDQFWSPAPIADRVLELLNDPHFTNELALFNLEINLDPMTLEGSCLADLHGELDRRIAQINDVMEPEGGRVLLTGILPSLHKSDLSLDNITPKPRYFALNQAMTRMRGGPLRLLIEGTDELHIEHDSVMLEACNTSFQVHLQVEAGNFASFYNVAQAIAGPVLAAAVNSPLLFGKRLWEETRIAVFQQSIDTRNASPHLRELSPRVRFGERWLSRSVIEAFQEDVARFRVLLASDLDEDPFRMLAEGKIPQLQALKLHNSTVYRWNRPCYGVNEGKPHLRIECRALPAGPTTVDEVANAAFWLGLMIAGPVDFGDVRDRLAFDDAKANFLTAARHGLRAGFSWFDGENISAVRLILDHLLPMAEIGLRTRGIDEDDISRYLGIIERRVATGRTGARWILDSGAKFRTSGSRAERLAAITSSTARQQATGKPVHEWPPANLGEERKLAKTFRTVEQFMDVDLFTVREDELVDLAAFLMDRKGLRHVLVENHNHQLVGIISYRSLIRLLADGNPSSGPVPVQAIMERNPITISPETTSLEAIDVMRSRKVSALPVVKNGKLVGLVSERSFLDLAAEFFKDRLRSEAGL